MLVLKRARLFHAYIVGAGDTLTLLGLNLRIPVYRDGVAQQAVWRHIQRRLATVTLEIQALLEPEAGELLAIKILDDWQDVFDSFLV